MKRTLQILILFFIIACSNNYEEKEFNVIQDIANDFLIKNHLKNVLKDPFEEIYERPLYVDTLDLKVYLSDALLPISQIKEDNEWMFENKKFKKEDSIIFYNLVNSKKFQTLNYREFEKNKLKFKKPYRQFEKSEEKLKDNEEYSILSFSRVCIDDKEENGVVVIEFRNGKEELTIYGSHRVYLIKKKYNKWEYIPEK